MKLLYNVLVAFALILTLVSGLCLGCEVAGTEHRCCGPQKQAPNCHEPQPKEQEPCSCPDTGRILASAVVAKDAGNLVKPEVSVVAVIHVAAVEFPVWTVRETATRASDIPSPDLLSLNRILRI